MRIMTRIFKRWYGNKSSDHPSTHALTPDELVALKVYSIDLNYYFLYFMMYSKSDSLYVVMLL